MKIKQILDEAKKGVKAPKNTIKPRNFVAKNAVQSGAGAHKDKKKAAKQGDVKHKGQVVAEYGDTARGQKMLTKVQKRAVDRVVSKKADIDPKYAKKNKDTADRAWDRMKDVAEGFDGEYDDETGMAANQLQTIQRCAREMEENLIDGENLPEWVQSKITIAKESIVTAFDYILSQHQNGEIEMDEATNNPDLMSASDYDRYQQSQMDADKREFKRQELEHELGHEDRGYYQVMIAKNGKWEYAKAQPRREGMNAAMSIISSLHAKYPSMHLGMMWPDGHVENYGKGR